MLFEDLSHPGNIFLLESVIPLHREIAAGSLRSALKMAQVEIETFSASPDPVNHSSGCCNFLETFDPSVKPVALPS